MNSLIILFIGCFFASSFVSAHNLTQESIEKTQAVISQVIEAYGGSEKLNQLNSLIIEFESINLAINQSQRPDPPWDEVKMSESTKINFEKQQFVTQAQSKSDNRSFSFGTIINGEKSFEINYRTNIAVPIAEPDFINTAAGFIRTMPALLVKKLIQRAHTSHYLGEAAVDEKPHDVVTLVMEVGPAISLYFDKKTHLLNKAERHIDGFGMLGYRFYDYINVDGIPFNQRFVLLTNDGNNSKRNINIQVNPSIIKYTAISKDMTVETSVNPGSITRQKISDGVYLIGGDGTYAMFIEMKDHVIAVGGTAGIPERIALLKEVLPNKPIKYGVMTHHHSDHILGVQAYADEGAVVIAAESHENVIRSATDNKKLIVETVKKRRIFKSGDREIRIIDVGPTQHSEHLLVAYLPKEGILFQADHFNLSNAGNIRPASKSTQDFAENIKSAKIKATKIFSAHSSQVATHNDLAKAIKLGKKLN